MRALGMSVAVGDLLRLRTSSSAQFQNEPADDVKGTIQNRHADRSTVHAQGTPVRMMTTDISFESFRLLPAQFLLLEDEKPVPLGSRALEILVALIERPGELISKQELMARVWPNVFVEPANLTVHISALRRALRDGCDGKRYIVNVPGRGYSFVARITAAIKSPTLFIEDASRSLTEFDAW